MPTRRFDVNKEQSLAQISGANRGNGHDDHCPTGRGSYDTDYKFQTDARYAHDWSGMGQVTKIELKIKLTNEVHTAHGGSRRARVQRLDQSFTSGGGSENGWATGISGDVWPGASVTGTVDEASLTAWGNGDWATINISDAYDNLIPSTVLTPAGTPGQGDTNYGIRISSSDDGSTSRSFEFWGLRSSFPHYVVVTYTTNAAPSQPVLDSPIGGATVTGSLDFDWAGSDPDAGDTLSGYDLQVSTVNTFATTLYSGVGLTAGTVSGFNVTNAPYVGPALPTSTTLYWRVRNKDALGSAGPWSGAGQFAMGAPASSDRPAVASPLPSAGLADIWNLGELAVWTLGGAHAKPVVRFTYSHPGGRSMAAYRLRLYNSAGALPALYDSTVVSASAAAGDSVLLNVPYAIVLGTTYKWGVEVQDVDGNWSTDMALVELKVRWGQGIYSHNVVAAATTLKFTTGALGGTGARMATLFMSSDNADGTGNPTSWVVDIGGLSSVRAYVRACIRLAATVSGQNPTLGDATLTYRPPSGASAQPDKWLLNGTGTVLLDSSVKRFGFWSARLEAGATSDIYLYPFRRLAGDGIEVQEHTDYAYSVYVRTEAALPDPALISIEVRTVDGVGVLAALEPIADEPLSTRDTTAAKDGWQRLAGTITIPGGVTACRPVIRLHPTAAGQRVWIDGAKFEEGKVTSLWTPGFIGSGSVLDSLGVIVDATQGGIFRLKGSTGDTNPRDVVTLGSRGLAFGDTSPVEVYSPQASVLHVSAPRLDYLPLATIPTPGAPMGILHADPVGTLYWKKADGTDAPVTPAEDSGYGGNMLQNGGFRDGTAYWSLYADTLPGANVVLRDPSLTDLVLGDGDIPGWVPGTTTLRGSTLQFTANTGVGATRYPSISQQVPITGGQYYSFSGLFGNMNMLNIWAGLYWYDGAGTSLGYVDSPGSGVSGKNGGPALSDWFLSVINGVQAPSTARYMSFILFMATPSTAAPYYAMFDQMWFGVGKIARRYVVLPPATGTSSGTAGGVLAGTYPNPGFAVDMATQAELNTHAATPHSGSSSPSGAAGGVLGGTYPNPTFSADMATQVELDAEVTARTAADTAHTSAGDPHTGYQKESEKDANGGYVGLANPQGARTGVKFLRDDGTWQVVAGSGGAGGTPTGPAGGVLDGDYPDPTFATPMATQAGLDAHATAGDPHTAYQKESEKGVASGYASLDAGALIPIAQHGTGTPDGTKFLRDDRVWVAPPAGGGGGVIDATYLVGTAHAGLSAEIVVGSTPGGELGGSWVAPTVDAVHSGSSHASTQAAAEASAATAGASNLLKNGGFRDGLACWITYYPAGGQAAMYASPAYTLADGDVPGWTPTTGALRGSTAYLLHPVTSVADSICYVEQKVPAVAGQYYSASGLVGNHRFTLVRLQFGFLNAAGGTIDYGVSTQPANLPGGEDYDDWSLLTIPGVLAPAGTRSLSFSVAAITPTTDHPNGPAYCFMDQLWVGVGKVPHRFQVTPASYQDGSVRVDGTGRAGVNTNPDASTLAVAPADGNIHLIHGGATGAGMWVDSYDYSKRWFVGGSGGHSGFRIYGQGIGDAFIVQADGNIALRGGGVLMSGAGVPEGVVVANRGTMYLRTDGGPSSTLYVKTSNSGSNTGWTAK